MTTFRCRYLSPWPPQPHSAPVSASPSPRDPAGRAPLAELPLQKEKYVRLYEPCLRGSLENRKVSPWTHSASAPVSCSPTPRCPVAAVEMCARLALPPAPREHIKPWVRLPLRLQGTTLPNAKQANPHSQADLFALQSLYKEQSRGVLTERVVQLCVEGFAQDLYQGNFRCGRMPSMQERVRDVLSKLSLPPNGRKQIEAEACRGPFPADALKASLFRGVKKDPSLLVRLTNQVKSYQAAIQREKDPEMRLSLQKTRDLLREALKELLA